MSFLFWCTSSRWVRNVLLNSRNSEKWVPTITDCITPDCNGLVLLKSPSGATSGREIHLTRAHGLWIRGRGDWRDARVWRRVSSRLNRDPYAHPTNVNGSTRYLSVSTLYSPPNALLLPRPESWKTCDHDDISVGCACVLCTTHVISYTRLHAFSLSTRIPVSVFLRIRCFWIVSSDFSSHEKTWTFEFPQRTGIRGNASGAWIRVYSHMER